ncbi:hypothetical protein L3Q82_014193, partial [Scortum barcoo]
ETVELPHCLGSIITQDLKSELNNSITMKEQQRMNLLQQLKKFNLPKIVKEFCHLLGTTVSLSSGYHPESNGQTERMNQELETCLRCLVAQNQMLLSDHSPGWSTHIMHSPQQPLDSRPFRSCMARQQGGSHGAISPCHGQKVPLGAPHVPCEQDQACAGEFLDASNEDVEDKSSAFSPVSLPVRLSCYAMVTPCFTSCQACI